MAQLLKVNAKVNINEIADHFEDLCQDPTLMLNLHNTLARMCDPYVPYLNNPLSRTVQITPEYIEYVQPYAHYQYHGVHFKHTLTHHPLASAEWDQAMLRDHRQEFEAAVQAKIIRRYKELYG